MVDQPRIHELLEEVIESERTPEEVCQDCPELLPEVRKGLERFRKMESQIEAVFPSSSDSLRDARLRYDDADSLPHIPGYEVEGILGRGGMGVVFRARHIQLKRPVALKMLLAGSYAAPLEKMRFKREAEAEAALRHPNVVQIY